MSISNPIQFEPIGILHSDHQSAEKTPIQPVYAHGCQGWIEIYEQYASGLKDLEGFSHIYLLYWFHKAKPAKLILKPFLQDSEHGIFATRAPNRPNPIGLSVVNLIKRDKRILYLDGVDILDGTPILDIKPYTARFDRFTTTSNGWQDEVEKEILQSGNRNHFLGGNS